MKRSAFVLSLCLSAFAVQASPPTPAEPGTPAAPGVVVQETKVGGPGVATGEAAVVTTAEASKPALDPGCVRESGTRIKKRDKKGCTGAPGTSYSRADIDRTGAVDTADAVRKHSTSGTVSRGN